MAKFVMMGNYHAGVDGGHQRLAHRTGAGGGPRPRRRDDRESTPCSGAFDLMLIVELPDVETAMRVSLELTRLTGVGFRTSPAVDVAAFDALASE